MERIEFVVPAVPIAQPRHRIGTIAGKARAFQAPKSHPIHDFKASVRVAAAEAYSGPVLDCPIFVDLFFVLPRPKNKRWKTRPMPSYSHTSRPDIDNLAKGFIDALTGLIWIDDSQIYGMKLQKVVASGDEQPHVEVQFSWETEA